MGSWKVVAAAVVPVVVIVAACGGSEAASTDIAATLQEFSFSPSEWTVPAGQHITIELTNAGSVLHEWVLLKPGVQITAETDLPETEEELLADFVYFEDEIEAGETKSVTFTAPEAGTYQVICAIEGHFTGGMNATLTVVAP